MNKKKLSILCTEGSLKSTSLREIAKGLSTALCHKVLRTTKVAKRRQQIKYGQGVDKLTQYKWFEEQGIPALEFTTSMAQAMRWNETDIVFGRELLNGSCGKGIHILLPTEHYLWTALPVYTLYKRKKREFRVHIFKDQVVCVVEKKRKVGWDGQQDTKIRNLANGYVFCQDVLNEPEGLRPLALRAACISPSDFRGVDIGFNEKKQELFVIEVNGQPGIQGSNIAKYLEKIVNYVQA